MTAAEDNFRRLQEFMMSRNDIETGATETVEATLALTSLDRLIELREFVLSNGIQFLPMVGLKRTGELGRCFQNALGMAVRENLTYVEGFALRSTDTVAMHHAWCTQNETIAIDPTWAQPDVAYFGVQFSREYALERFDHFETGPELLDQGSLLNDPTNSHAILRGGATNWRL